MEEVKHESLPVFIEVFATLKATHLCKVDEGLVFICRVVLEDIWSCRWQRVLPSTPALVWNFDQSQFFKELSERVSLEFNEFSPTASTLSFRIAIFTAQ